MAIYTYNGKIVVDSGKIAIHQNCCCITREWKRCSDDVAVAWYDTGGPTNDYAWLCISGIWVKCYEGSLVFHSATNPSYLDQCGTAPTACSGLIGWHASDDFGGSGCNSGSVGDTNWNKRGWASSIVGPGSGSNAIVSNHLEKAVTSNGSSNTSNQTTLTCNHSGNFEVEIDCTTAPTDSTNYIGYALYVYIGSDLMRLGIDDNSGALCYWQANGESLNSLGDIYGTYTIKITRQSDNKIRFYLGGVLQGTSSNTYSGNMTSIAIDTDTYASSQRKWIFSYMTAVGDSGNIIAYDPTGESC